MTDTKEKEMLLKMVGTQGLLELESILNLLSKSDLGTFGLSCRLLNQSIYRIRKNLEKELNEGFQKSSGDC